MTMLRHRVYNTELLGKLQQIENELLEQRKMINALGVMVQRIGDMVNEMLGRIPPNPQNDPRVSVK